MDYDKSGIDRDGYNYKKSGFLGRDFGSNEWAYFNALLTCVLAGASLAVARVVTAK